MATKTFMGFDPDTGEPSEFEGKLARKTQKAIGSTEKAAFRTAMGIPAAAEGLVPSQNLADVDDVSVSRDNLAVLSSTQVNDRQLSKTPVNGLVFNGSTSEIEVAHNAVLDFSTNVDFTLEAIIYHDGNSSSNRTISTTRAAGASGHQILIGADNRFHSYLSDGTNSLSSSASDPSGGDALSAGWYHLAVTFDRDGNMTRYVNGAQYGAALSLSGASVGDVSNSNQLDIGNRNSGDEFIGLLSLYAIYNRALSAAEVLRKSIDQTFEFAGQGCDSTTQTSGTLTVGKRYRIETFVAGDDFTNVGAASNATGVEFIATGTTPTTYSNGSTVRRIGVVLALLPQNILPNGNVNDTSNGLRAIGTSITPLMRPSGGQYTEQIELAHGSISSSAATTTLLTLSQGCRIVGIETIVDTAFDASTTINIGITGTATKYVNALDVASTGRNYNSSTAASESDTATTSIYVQKNQATTLGNAKFRVVYEITNPTG